MTPDAPIPTLLLLGGAELRGAPDAAAAERLLAQPKLVALLACLVLAGDPADADSRSRPRHVRRDRLLGLLWPELEQARARNALSKALGQLRQTLGADAVVTRGDEEVALAPGVLRCDAVLFLQAVADGELARALERYRGELLPGFHLAECAELGQWLDAERQELASQAAGAAWALARRYEGDGQLSAAGQWARRAARAAWDDERALRRALQMLDRLGDRAGALRLFDDFARRLRTEYEAEPSAETQALVATLRGG